MAATMRRAADEAKLKEAKDVMGDELKGMLRRARGEDLMLRDAEKGTQQLAEVEGAAAKGTRELGDAALVGTRDVKKVMSEIQGITRGGEGDRVQRVEAVKREADAQLDGLLKGVEEEERERRTARREAEEEATKPGKVVFVT